MSCNPGRAVQRGTAVLYNGRTRLVLRQCRQCKPGGNFELHSRGGGELVQVVQWEQEHPRCTFCLSRCGIFLFKKAKLWYFCWVCEKMSTYTLRICNIFLLLSLPQVGSYSYDMTRMLFRVSQLTFIQQQSIVLDYNIQVRKKKYILYGIWGFISHQRGSLIFYRSTTSRRRTRSSWPGL